MDTALELHDSIFANRLWRGTTLVLQLRPAYVHRMEAGSATGWAQDVDLLLHDAVVDELTGAPPLRLSDGWVDAGGSRWDGMIPLPFQADGPVRAELHGPNDFHLIASGSGLEIIPAGEAVYVEGSPWEGWPG